MIRCLAAVLVLALPAAALAAAPWSDPVDLSAPHLFISAPGVAFTGDGTAVATWGWQDGTKLATAATGSHVAYRPAGGVWTAERRVRGLVAAAPVGFGKRRWAVPTQTATDATGNRTRVAVVFGRAGGTPRKPQRIRTANTLSRVQLASNDRGRMALAFTQRSGGSGRAFVATRRPGRRFGKAHVVARGAVRNVSVAVGARGDVLVAWEDRGRMRARIRSPHGKHFGRQLAIKSRPAYTRELRTELTASGVGRVAWVSQFLSEGGETGPIYVQAAVKPRGRPFRRAQLLDELDPLRGIRGLALDGGSAAWVGHDGANYVVRYARTTVSGSFGPATDLPGGTGDFGVDDLAGGVLTLTRYFGADADTGSQIVASHDFGAPEEVSAAQEAYGARVAADPGGGVTAVWVNRPEGSRHPIAEIRTMLQASSRP